jgi:murein DD-endopeptidase MepM/ murein hydrolase activator NlpD
METPSEGLIRKPITSETKEWAPDLDTQLPINPQDIPNFKAWINWNGFEFDSETWKGPHKGFDFGAYLTNDNKIILGLPEGTKIRAIADGKVILISKGSSITGNYDELNGYFAEVRIAHGMIDSGMGSHYLHAVPLVEKGEEVKKGDVIATLHKDSGEDRGRLVHLHLEMINAPGTKKEVWWTKPVDPKILDESLLKFSAIPQGSAHFSVPGLSGIPIETVNFKELWLSEKS